MSTLTELLKRKFVLDQQVKQFDRDMLHFVHGPDTMVLTDDQFWDATDVLLEQLCKSLKYRKDFDAGLKHAIDECMRSQLVKNRGQATLKVICRYVATYETIAKRISEGLDKFHGVDRGDDSFGDLVDLLPLAGRDVCQVVMTRTSPAGKRVPSDFQYVEDMLKEHPWAKYILHGEHYVRATLMDSLIEKMIIPANDEHHPSRNGLMD